MLCRSLVLVPLALVLLAPPLVGDQIYLKTGKKIDGTIVAEHPDRVEVKLASGEVKTISRDDIALIQKTSAGAAEFKKRLAALPDDDIDAYLDLAAWCEANRLRRQRKTVLKRALKVDPDCPEANRAMLRRWNGDRWIRDRSKGEVEAPQAGSKSEYEKIGLTLTTPTGWKTRDDGEKGLTMSGPQRYRRPVTLEITLSPIDSTSAFADADARWSAPEDVTFGKLAGRTSDRLHRDGSLRLKTREYVLAGNGWMLRFRFTALEVEFGDWRPHVDLVLRSLVVHEPKLDFKSLELGIGFRFPGIENWTVGQMNNPDKVVIGAILIHRGEGPEEFCSIIYTQQDVSDEVAADLDQGLAGRVRSTADVRAKKDARLGPLKARLWEADTLQRGVPVFQMNLIAIQGKKGHFFTFQCLEQSEKRFRPAFEKLCSSFVLGVK